MTETHSTYILIKEIKEFHLWKIKKYIELLEDIRAKEAAVDALTESKQNIDNVEEQIEMLEDIELKAIYKFANYLKEKYGFRAAFSVA